MLWVLSNELHKIAFCNKTRKDNKQCLLDTPERSKCNGWTDIQDNMKTVYQTPPPPPHTHPPTHPHPHPHPHTHTHTICEGLGILRNLFIWTPILYRDVMVFVAKRGVRQISSLSMNYYISPKESKMSWTGRQMDGKMNAWMDNVKTVYPQQIQFKGGLKRANR